MALIWEGEDGEGRSGLHGFPAADSQLGLHSCLLLPVDIGCVLRAEVGEGSSSHPPTSLPVLTMKASLRMNSGRNQALFSKEHKACPGSSGKAQFSVLRLSEGQDYTTRILSSFVECKT